MLKDKMEKAINDQIKWEVYSSYLYLSMSAYFESVSLKGFASWMRIQFMEELTHAKRFYDFVIARGGRVILTEIMAPPADWDSPQAVFEETLKHEQHVTSRINDLVDLAQELKDHATNSFLQWFVDEQVEEEESVDEVLQSLKLNENNPGGLFMIDKELAQRAFVAPADVTL
ncbi:MAG: ferritin [Nitrospiraceae bacterium]|nr:MAG: ferritin [Nitrospiraceae bacterium]UCH46271.1 MAG: ferritin [Nitrospiraceae bacterium]